MSTVQTYAPKSETASESRLRIAGRLILLATGMLYWLLATLVFVCLRPVLKFAVRFGVSLPPAHDFFRDYGATPKYRDYFVHLSVVGGAREWAGETTLDDGQSLFQITATVPFQFSLIPFPMRVSGDPVMTVVEGYSDGNSAGFKIKDGGLQATFGYAAWRLNRHHLQAAKGLREFLTEYVRTLPFA